MSAAEPAPPSEAPARPAGFFSRLRRHLARLGRRRIEVIRQMTVYECGAASLAMILNHFGRETTLKETRQILDAGRDGTSISGIARCARELGLVVRHFSVTIE